jgi:hypothetical protein
MHIFIEVSNMFQKHTSFSIANVCTWSYKWLRGNNFHLKNLRRSFQFIEWDWTCQTWNCGYFGCCYKHHISRNYKWLINVFEVCSYISIKFGWEERMMMGLWKHVVSNTTCALCCWGAYQMFCSNSWTLVLFFIC